MLHHVLELGSNLLGHFWPLILAICTLIPVLALTVLGIYLRRKIAGMVPGQIKDSKSDLAAGALASLHRLPKDRYQFISNIEVPRLDDRGTTHLNHIVLSPHGIFVIQVQEETGHVTGAKTDSKWKATVAGVEDTFVNPLIRNRYHVKALARFLGLPEALFHSIIYFPNVVRFETEPPADILTARLGRHILSHKAEIISPEVISRAFEALNPLEGAGKSRPIITSGRPASAPLLEKHAPLRQHGSSHAAPRRTRRDNPSPHGGRRGRECSR